MIKNFQPNKNEMMPDETATDTQGFEKASNNLIFVNDNYCSKCLRSFNQTGRQSYRINVMTKLKKDIWCAECVEKGVKEGICLQESKLSKEEKKLWQKKYEEKKINT